MSDDPHAAPAADEPQDLDLDAFWAGGVMVLDCEKVTVGGHRVTLHEVPTAIWWKARDMMNELLEKEKARNAAKENPNQDANETLSDGDIEDLADSFESGLLAHDSLLVAASLLRGEPTEEQRVMVAKKFGSGSLANMKPIIMRLSGRVALPDDDAPRADKDPLPNASGATAES